MELNTIRDNFSCNQVEQTHPHDKRHWSDCGNEISNATDYATNQSCDSLIHAGIGWGTHDPVVLDWKALEYADEYERDENSNSIYDIGMNQPFKP